MPSLQSIQLLITIISDSFCSACACLEHDWMHGESKPTTLLCVMTRFAKLLATHLLLTILHNLAGQCCSGVTVHIWLKASSKTMHMLINMQISSACCAHSEAQLMLTVA